jgi:hypothetical protein
MVVASDSNRTVTALVDTLTVVWPLKLPAFTVTVMARLAELSGVVNVYFTLPLASVTLAVPPVAGSTEVSTPELVLGVTVTLGTVRLLASRTIAVIVAATELSEGIDVRLLCTIIDATLAAALVPVPDAALEAKELPLSLPPPPHAASASVANQTRIPELRISVHPSC